jgi:hypothetical protein
MRAAVGRHRKERSMNTQPQSLEAVIERLEKVEGRCSALATQNRAMRVGWIVALLLVAAIVWASTARTGIVRAPSKFGSISAEKLEIADSNGTTRLEGGTLTIRQQGDKEPGITIYDKDGNVIRQVTPGGARPLRGSEGS